MNRSRMAAWVLSLSLLVACNDDKRGAPTPATSASVPALTSSTAPAPPTAAVTTKATEAVVPDAIAAQHILVAYKGAKGAAKTIVRSKVDAKKRAEEVATKAKTGDFTALVAEYSDDPGSKERQGSLGKFTREKMTKPFSDAAFTLRVDEVSPVVETDFGFHVIKRNQ